MRDHFGIFVAFVIVIATGCKVPAPEAVVFDRQAVEVEVSDWLDGFWATWSKGIEGFDRGMALYDNHPDYSFAAGGNLWLSHTAGSEAFRPGFEIVQQQTLEFEQKAITVLTRDLVYTAQQGTYSQTYADGTTSEVKPLAFTMLLVRSDGLWKARFAHLSEPATE